MLSDVQIDLIRRSAERLAASNMAATDAFYVKLFQTAPAVRPLFSEDMFEQSEKLWQSIVMIVESADNLDQIRLALMALGKRHVDYGAEPSHYAIVTDVLIETMSTLMRDEWSADYRAAWTAALGAVCETMLEGAGHRAH